MKKIAFISYFADTKDRIADITQDEYELLKPYSSELSRGNWPNEVSDLIGDIMNNRSKSVNDVDDYDIEVAIC